ncbi:hypothetical protein TNCV_5001551 [Trichonephila clavipes]|nr:hypothetical protein TNCV_5001551 [Trichonephila clavipes]
MNQWKAIVTDRGNKRRINESNVAGVELVKKKKCEQSIGGVCWYRARTHDMPAMIRYLDHWATTALTGASAHAPQHPRSQKQR